MEDGRIDGALLDELREFSTEYPALTFELVKLRSDSLTGETLPLAVVTFVISSIAGGMLADIGRDGWNRLKGLCRRLLASRQDDERCHVVVRVDHRVGRTTVHLVCDVASNEDIERLDSFTLGIPGVLDEASDEHGNLSLCLKNAPGDGSETIEVVYEPDGTWRWVEP